jgi:hypothetical protein
MKKQAISNAHNNFTKGLGNVMLLTLGGPIFFESEYFLNKIINVNPKCNPKKLYSMGSLTFKRTNGTSN